MASFRHDRSPHERFPRDRERILGRKLELLHELSSIYDSAICSIAATDPEAAFALVEKADAVLESLSRIESLLGDGSTPRQISDETRNVTALHRRLVERLEEARDKARSQHARILDAKRRVKAARASIQIEAPGQLVDGRA